MTLNVLINLREVCATCAGTVFVIIRTGVTEAELFR